LEVPGFVDLDCVFGIFYSFFPLRGVRHARFGACVCFGAAQIEDLKTANSWEEMAVSLGLGLFQALFWIEQTDLVPYVGTMVIVAWNLASKNGPVRVYRNEVVFWRALTVCVAACLLQAVERFQVIRTCC